MKRYSVVPWSPPPYTEFTFDRDTLTCHCPAGKKMRRTGRNTVMFGQRVVRFRGADSACLGCPLRAKCIRKPDKTKLRQVAFFLGTAPRRVSSHGARMRERIDSTEMRALYGRRFATLVHNIEKMAHHGYAKAA